MSCSVSPFITEFSGRNAKCSVCLYKSPAYLLICERCQAVFYCSQTCAINDIAGSKDDVTKHKFWCEKSASYRSDVDITSFPFSFASETTSSCFTEAVYELFLIRCGVLNQGFWSLEVTSALSNTLSYGELQSVADPFVLPSESVTLEDVDVKLPAVSVLSWLDYYTWRGFHIDSPIAILLQWPLTMYFILISCLPIDYDGCQKSSTYTIHCVGAGKESDLHPAFTELTVLLPSSSFDIHFVGPAISKTADEKSFTSPNSCLSAKLHHGLYHNVYTRLPKPDLIVGFNAGLVAYTSWIESIKLLAKSKVPAYFTEYSWKIYELTRLQMCCLNKSTDLPAAVAVSDGRLNPFRSPIRVHDPHTEIPAFSNAVLFHLQYGPKAVNV